MQDKLSYASSRGQSPFLDNKKRPGKLRSHLKDFEVILSEQSVAFSTWRNSKLFQLMFSSGLLVSIFLNKLGDIERLVFDKYLVGRLLDFIADVQFSSRHLVVTYLESRVHVIHFGKVLNFCGDFDSLANFDPKINLVDILGPAGRR